MKNKKTTILCIRCPKGCQLNVNQERNKIHVSGNECKLGEKYALEEIKNPKRIITSTVRIKNAKYPRLPVRTEKEISKNKINQVINSIQNITIKAPVKHHEIIVKNVADTKINIISERDMERI